MGPGQPGMVTLRNRFSKQKNCLKDFIFHVMSVLPAYIYVCVSVHHLVPARPGEVTGLPGTGVRDSW